MISKRVIIVIFLLKLQALNLTYLFFIFLQAFCWIKDVKEKPTFVIVRGSLQGATSTAINKKLDLVPISKFSFLKFFKNLLKTLKCETDDAINYSKAKELAKDYNKALDCFFQVYKEWIKTDREKYYSFSI